MIRTYRLIAGPAASAAVGTTADVPPQSAGGYPGYFQVALSGPTSARPKAGAGDMPPAYGNAGALQAGILFLDTTLGYIVVSDGTGAWRNPNSGASV
jgi:hypothetical protein